MWGYFVRQSGVAFENIELLSLEIHLHNVPEVYVWGLGDVEKVIRPGIVVYDNGEDTVGFIVVVALGNVPYYVVVVGFHNFSIIAEITFTVTAFPRHLYR